MALHPQVRQQPHQHSEQQLQRNSHINSEIPAQFKTACRQQQQQIELDGKRTLIKNQLYLIEQLQLENANLRNERDQLQLENEELKFQLQMISSSNILSQPGSTFNDQPLEPLVDNGGARTSGANSNTTNITPVTFRPELSVAALTNNIPVAKGTSNSTEVGSTARLANHTTDLNQVKLLATPLRQLVKVDGEPSLQYSVIESPSSQMTVRSLATNTTDGFKARTGSIETMATVSALNATKNNPSVTAPLPSAAHFRNNMTNITTNRLIDGKSTSLIAFKVKPGLAQPKSRDLPQDDEERQIKLVEQRYGHSEEVRAAAIIIQRAFRRYQICKRFRTITEQLRHTCQSVSQSDEFKRADNSIATSADRKDNVPDPVPYVVSGTTRAAAWESLSIAASRLAASAAAATAAANLDSHNKQNGIPANGLGGVKPAGGADQQVVVSCPITTMNVAQSTQRPPKQQQDAVVAAAINFQQLESIRKRQYRVGLNIFNKNPEKGISFLVAHSFIDTSSPYTKSLTGYYHSNQMHFIDKQQVLAHQQAVSVDFQSCQLCCEEDNLKRNVAHFLLHRKGLAKEKIGQYLGNLQSQFNQDVLRYYLQELDFFGQQIDLALRKFLSTFRLPGEAQKIERIVDCFAQRYVQCQLQQTVSNIPNGNDAQIQLHQQTVASRRPKQTSIPQPQSVTNCKNNLILLSKDEIFILTFAIIMLNTDLHSPSLKPTSRMSGAQFVNNLRGVFKSQTIHEGDLIEIYERVKSNQITTTPDHVTHVMKVQKGLTVTNFPKKELPNLCVPHRRLVCFCRLFEVYDINKKERVGQHQREIFLFNDLLLVTKLARRVRNNAGQLHTYRQSISLQGLDVQLFQSPHYNLGIRLCQRSNDETIIMFNAKNEVDRGRFVDDLSESIAEMDEMESIKAHNVIETIHYKYQDRLKRHAMMHNINGNVDPQFGVDTRDKILINNCDTRIRVLDKEDSNQSGRYPVTLTSSKLVTSPGHRVLAKFSSMLNLSSVAEGTSVSNRDCPTIRGLAKNQLSTRQSSQIRRDDRTSGRSDPAIQRRGSSGSVHSLDSGLFLSRDVSPNQSS